MFRSVPGYYCLHLTSENTEDERRGSDFLDDAQVVTDLGQKSMSYDSSLVLFPCLEENMQDQLYPP